ncbi:MAG: hypothetical protein V3U49_02465 [Nitrososphaerales archaeon]
MDPIFLDLWIHFISKLAEVGTNIVLDQINPEGKEPEDIGVKNLLMSPVFQEVFMRNQESFEGIRWMLNVMLKETEPEIVSMLNRMKYVGPPFGGGASPELLITWIRKESARSET